MLSWNRLWRHASNAAVVTESASRAELEPGIVRLLEHLTPRRDSIGLKERDVLTHIWENQHE